MRPPDLNMRTPPAGTEAVAKSQRTSGLENVALEHREIKPGFDHDLIDHLFVEHFYEAPAAIKARFYAKVTPTVAGDALIHLARVRFESHRFEFDPDGPWAIVAPIYEAGWIADFAAFDLDDLELRRTYRIGHFAVGLEEAVWDAHYHPQRRLNIQPDVWSWLANECSGLLPICWHRTALFVRGESYDLWFDDERAARIVQARLAQALKLPRLFVVQSEAAS